MSKPTVAIKWASKVAEHDYAAARNYLTLKLGDDDAEAAVKRLRDGDLTARRANDIIRSSGLTAAPLHDPGVMKDLIKVIEGKKLSPILMLRGDTDAEIADGYHRASLVYQLDPYADIPLKLV